MHRAPLAFLAVANLLCLLAILTSDPANAPEAMLVARHAGP